MLDKIIFRKRVIKASVAFVTIIILFFSIITLSKYTTGTYSSDNARVAKWENNLEFIEQENNIIGSAKGKTISLKFNVLSSSEVSSKYNLTFENIPIGLGITIENDKHIRKVYISGEEITITFDSTSAVFERGTNSVKNYISYTLVKEGSNETLIFDDQINDTSIKVDLIDNKQNITFYDFEELLPGEVKREHQCTFEVLADNFLVSSLDVTAYATFEQLD